MDLAEQIRQMNQSSEEIKVPGDEGKETVKTESGGGNTPPPGGEEPTKTEPKKPTSAQPLNKDTKPPETSGIEKKETPTPTQTGGGEPPKGGEKPPVETGKEGQVVSFGDTLSALTEGHLKSEDDLVGVLQHYNALLTQAEEGFKPKFKDERARKVHQIVEQALSGDSVDEGLRTLRAMKFDPKGKTPKEVLFQEYLLDPKNSDLTETRAATLFEEEYNELYGDIEGSDRKKRQLELRVKEATAAIDKIQADFKAIDEEPQRISKEVEASIKQVASEFGGIRIAFTDNPTEMDYLNVPVNDQKVLANLHEIALNPPQAWERFVKQFETPKGFDYPGYFQALYEREHAAELRQQAYDHGYKQGQIALQNKLANASTKKDISDGGGAPPASSKPKSLAEAAFNAMSKR